MKNKYENLSTALLALAEFIYEVEECTKERLLHISYLIADHAITAEVLLAELNKKQTEENKILKFESPRKNPNLRLVAKNNLIKGKNNDKP